MAAVSYPGAQEGAQGRGAQGLGARGEGHEVKGEGTAKGMHLLRQRGNEAGRGFLPRTVAELVTPQTIRWAEAPLGHGCAGEEGGPPQPQAGNPDVTSPLLSRQNHFCSV